jgi:hypothetical protein
MSAFRGMYGMFRADLPLFRFLVFRPLQIARSEPREKLSHNKGPLIYIFDLRDLKRLSRNSPSKRVIPLVSFADPASPPTSSAAPPTLNRQEYIYTILSDKIKVILSYLTAD